MVKANLQGLWSRYPDSDSTTYTEMGGPAASSTKVMTLQPGAVRVTRVSGTAKVGRAYNREYL